MIDVKTLIGILGTVTTAMMTWFQEVIVFAPDYIPLIPAVPTAMYMLVKAYNEWQKGRIEREN